jgi:hypothetical protein
VVAFDPVHRHVPLCPFRALTGLSCPLCGGLRAVSELARGHLAAAARFNLLVVAAVPFVFAWWLVWLRTGRRPGIPKPVFAAVVALAVVFTVVRNL